METEFKGIVSGTEAGVSVSCDVIPGGSGLEIRLTDGTVMSLLYVDMEVTLSGVEDRYLTFRAGHRERTVTVLVPDREIAPRIEALGAPRSLVDPLHLVLRSKKRRGLGRVSVLVALPAFAVLLVVLVWLGFDAGVRRAVALVPAEWEHALGQSAASQILAEKMVCSDPDLISVVSEIGTRLVGGVSSSHYRFTVRVLDDPDVNAFALPGGYIFVNRGLIEQAADGFEVAGVIAHELQHVLLRHGIHNVARQAGSMMILRTALGDAGAIEQFLMVNAAELASMSFSREQEAAADTAGLALMYRASMDATGLPRFLDKVAAEQGPAGEMLSIVSSHPGSKARADTLRATIASTPPAKVIPLGFDFSRAKGRCVPVRLSDPDGRLEE